MKLNIKKTPNKKKPESTGTGFNWIYFIVGGVLLSLILNQFSGSLVKEINEADFFNYLKAGDVKKIVVQQKEEIDVYLVKAAFKKPIHNKDKNIKAEEIAANTSLPQYKFQIGDLQLFEQRFLKLKEENKLNATIEFKNNQDPFYSFLINWGIPILLMLGLWMFVFRKLGSGSGMGGGIGGGQIFNIGKSKAKLFDENAKAPVTFKDVAGLEGAKEEVQEIVDFLKNPGKYTVLGGKIPRGALLVGPPGTGKTLLAKAVAGEANVPFFSLSGSDFVEMFVGVGASRVRDLFKQAQDKSPSIIFIDEIDAIGRARGKNNMTGGNDERENTLNQLLTEMDGFGTDSNVIVIAATNRADILDKALLRPGRFDRTISVDLPELNERKEIFNVHLKNIKIDNTIDIEFLSKQTPGFSGADIANLCNEAALIAARTAKKSVEKQDFLDAVDRIIGGLEKRGKVIKPKERKRIAFHESGHAAISWLVEHASPLLKVTIIPRGKSLGAAWYLPEERQITTTEQMLDEICATLGGRAAEELIFGNISTGALSDLERVTKQASAMVTIYGLNKEIGNISYYDSSGQSDYGFNKPYSEKTAEKIDQQISEIIETQYKRALDILAENKDKLTSLAETLLVKEVIFSDDLEVIFGKRAYQEDEVTIEG